MNVGEPKVGEVTHLAVVDKNLMFTYNLTTPGCRGEVSRGCYRHCGITCECRVEFQVKT